jgi:hypothetical protein
MIRPLKKTDGIVQARMKRDPKLEGKLEEINEANKLWKEIGRQYQFLSVPAPSLIMSIAMFLEYFNLLPNWFAYTLIALSFSAFIILQVHKEKIYKTIEGKTLGSNSVHRLYKLGSRISLTFAVGIYLLCIS